MSVGQETHVTAQISRSLLGSRRVGQRTTLAARDLADVDDVRSRGGQRQARRSGARSVGKIVVWRDSSWSEFGFIEQRKTTVTTVVIVSTTQRPLAAAVAVKECTLVVRCASTATGAQFRGAGRAGIGRTVRVFNLLEITKTPMFCFDNLRLVDVNTFGLRIEFRKVGLTFGCIDCVVDQLLVVDVFEVSQNVTFKRLSIAVGHR